MANKTQITYNSFMKNKQMPFSVLIDSANQDLFICFWHQKQMIVQFHFEKLKHKVEKIVEIFTSVLKTHNLNLKNLQKFYINLGPGSFTGSRIALVFARTICQLNDQAKLMTIDSLSWISLDFENAKEICIDARSQKFYCALTNQGILKSAISLKVNKENFQKNYSLFTKKIVFHLTKFKEEKNLLKIKVNYIKDPQIGAL